MKATHKVTNWSIVGDFSNPYLAPECRKCHLMGTVDSHSDFIPGSLIKTSRIEKLDWEKKIVETKHSIYILVGEPESGYATFLRKESN
jgi:hypothetical protein